MKENMNKKTDCEHSYKLDHTAWEYPVGISGTSAPVEMAYLVCFKCNHVKKELVEQP